MKTALMAALALSLIGIGSAHAVETGSEAYPAPIAQPIYSGPAVSETGSEAYPSFAGPRFEARSAVASTETWSEAQAQFAGQAAQTLVPGPGQQMTAMFRVGH